MAIELNPYEETDEEYIDIEVGSNSNFFFHHMNSPPHAREFEFQMFSISPERETTASPADELFYKGKLLPLQLPPRLQMVEKLLQNSNYHRSTTNTSDEYFTTPLTTTYNTPTANTPFESCNISPSESYRVSQELNPNEYFSTKECCFINEIPKKSWTRKLKRIKQSFKSFFNKSGCSLEGTVPKAKDYQSIRNKNIKAEKKTPFGQIQREKYQFIAEMVAPDGCGAQHRRSFSKAIKRISTTNCYSSSSSSTSSSSNMGNSNGSRFFNRSNSVSSDMENSIQGAIAHCKRSQEELHSRKTGCEIVFYSLSSPSVVSEDQERPGLCKG